MSKGKIAELEKLHRSLCDKRQADRVKAVIALSKGWSAAQVAEILLFDEKTSRHYFERYQQGGIPALLDDHYCGADPKLDEHQMSELERYLQEHILPDAKSVIAHIEKLYAVHYSLSGVTDLLHRMDFSYKKPTHVPGKQDPAQQQAFLEEYERIKAQKGENDPIYFADANHPQHNSVPSYGWIKKGQEKELKANCGRQRLNINGAIDIDHLDIVVDFGESVNAQSTVTVLQTLESRHPKAKKIYVYCDNARYYRCSLVREFVKQSKIVLLFLPPYSPNLNLIERLWKYFRKQILYNKYYEHFADFVAACRDFFEHIKGHREDLRTLLTENFQLIGA